MRPVPLSLGRVTIAGDVSGISYDYYVDSVSGSDSNDGTSVSNAWATLSKLDATLLSAGSTVAVLVAAGTYDTASDYILVQSGASAVTGAVLDVTFKSGCVMDGTNMAGSENGVEASGSNPWTLNLYGNGLTIQNYEVAGTNSPNGIGNRDSATIKAYDITCDGNNDNFSSHGDAPMYLYRCVGRNATKGEFLHVGNAIVYAEDCEFYPATGINGMATTTGTCEMVNCVIEPVTSGATWGFGDTIVRGGRIGSSTKSVQIVAATSGSGATIEDAYVHAYIDGNSFVTLTGCFGRLSTRLRNLGNILIDHCVFMDGALGQADAVLFQGYDPGSQGDWNAIDSIFTGYVTAVGSGFTATHAGYFTAAGNSVNYCCTYGNTTNFDADLTGADITTGNITTDPLLSTPGSSYDKADWGYTTGSPCIGAGSSGGNIGFAAA